MIDPTRENLPHLHKKEKQFFTSWLRAGLDGWFLEEKGSEAFVGASDYVGAGLDLDSNSLSLDLARVQRCLNASERHAFCDGIAEALARLAPMLPDDLEAVGPVITLLELAPLVSASQALDAILALTPRMLQVEVGEKSDLLMARTIDAVVSLAIPNDVALRCLRAITEFQAFRPALAYRTLLACCDAAPMELKQHLDMLWPKLSDSLGWSPLVDEKQREDDEAERLIKRHRLLRELFKRVPKSAFLKALLAPRGAPQLIAEARDWALDDNWLIQAALFPGNGMDNIRTSVLAEIEARKIRPEKIKPQDRPPEQKRPIGWAAVFADLALEPAELARHVKRPPIPEREDEAA